MYKKFLFLVILAILITGATYFIQTTPPGQLDASTSYRGLIIPYWSKTHATYDFGTGQFPTFPPNWSVFMFAIDIILWLLILNIALFFINKLRKSFKK